MSEDIKAIEAALAVHINAGNVKDAKILTDYLDSLKSAPSQHKPVFSPGQSATLQGLTLGFGDEALAGVAGAGRALGNIVNNRSPNLGAEYRNQLEIERRGLSDYREENPVSATAYELGGGIIPALFTGGASAPATAANTLRAAAQSGTRRYLGRVGRNSAAGAGFGAVSGFGSGEGDFESRAESGGIGGALGGGLGAAIPPVVSTVKALGLGVSNLLGLRSPGKIAQNNAIEALGRDGPDAPAKLAAALRAASPIPHGTVGSKPVVVADVAGENLKALGRESIADAGPAREAVVTRLNERQLGQGVRVGEDSKRLLSSVTDYYGADDALILQQKTGADPLYKKAHAANPSISDPEIDRILLTPAGQKALRNAAETMQDQMGEMGPRSAELEAIVKELVARGKMKAQPKGVASGLSLAALDQVRHSLYERSQKLYKDEEGKHAKAVWDRYEQLTAALDRVDASAKAGPNSTKVAGGFFAQARRAFAGPAQLRDAMEMGRNVLKQDVELTKRELDLLSKKSINGLGPGEKELFRAGVNRAIYDVMSGKDSTNRAAKLFESKAVRDRLESAFETKAQFNEFMKMMAVESKMNVTLTEVPPARTPSDGLEKLVGRSSVRPVEMLARILTGAKDRIVSGTSSRSNARLSELLYDPKNAARTISDAQAAIAKRAINAKRLARILQTTSGAAGTELGLSETEGLREYIFEK